MYIYHRFGQHGLVKQAEEVSARLKFKASIIGLSPKDWKTQVELGVTDGEADCSIEFEVGDQSVIMYLVIKNDREYLRMYSWGYADGLDRYDNPGKTKLVSHGEVPIGSEGEGINTAIRHALRVLFDMAITLDHTNERIKQLNEEHPLERSLN
jgi:hypothetical protein